MMARMYLTAAMVASVALAVLIGCQRSGGPAWLQAGALLASVGAAAVCVLVVTRKPQWDAAPKVAPILATSCWLSEAAPASVSAPYDPDYLIHAAPPALEVVRTYSDDATAAPVSTYDPDSLIGPGNATFAMGDRIRQGSTMEYASTPPARKTRPLTPEQREKRNAQARARRARAAV